MSQSRDDWGREASRTARFAFYLAGLALWVAVCALVLALIVISGHL